ncbi:ABC transporter ATP-binding protein/permease [Gleimia sp. 6138-11-ORH1]|uniref:ABC transporter ATP-binding protein n=1 Tax=Gleimia sp. 6138-11-ORH1 TaxID=2973937 RepID=UPI00216A066A|nr:ABC transporter ATP-binding protein [Gleimia sp. 6138-11-ORH1]MCS4483937.1 ABC transporter ATP-binding protein/permease [Gleimia sp. 6138-11-ORH1]
MKAESFESASSVPYTPSEMEENLRERAKAQGIKLPPIAREPNYRYSALKILEGKADTFPNEPKALAKQVLKRNWRYIAIGSTVATIANLATIYSAEAVSNLVDSGVEDGFGIYLLWPSLWVLSLILIAAITSALGQMFGIATWFSGTATVARSLSHRVSKRGISIHAKKETGDVVASATADVDYVGSTQWEMMELISASIATAVVIYLILQEDVTLGLIVIFGMPLLAMITALVIKPLQNKQGLQRQAQGELTTLSTDAVTGLRVLRGLGGEDQFMETYEQKNQEVAEKGYQVAVPQSLLTTFETSLPAIFVAFVVGYAALLVFDEKITVGTLIAIYAWTSYLDAPITALTWVIQAGTRAWVGVKKISSIFAVPGVVTNKREDGTTINYAAADLIDTNTELNIKAGKLTALVSTEPNQAAQVATRLARMDDSWLVQYQETEQAPIDVRKLDLNELRRNVILSSTDYHLFAGTLRDNILGAQWRHWPMPQLKEMIYAEVIENASREEIYSAPPWQNPADEQVIQALAAADATDILETLPGKLDGLISEKGRSLSGGQKQRICLARALFANPAVLILVEPTASVDSHTESRIAKRVAQKRQGQTTLIVTSSPLILEHCDEIVLLGKDGKEIARGTHAELSNQTGENALIYQSIVSRTTGSEA